jgi:hypothetical protein
MRIRSMTKPTLEPAAQRLADATSKPPFLIRTLRKALGTAR